MRSVPAPLLQELRKSAAGWTSVGSSRARMAQVFGFTSSDVPFTLDGVTYTPANGVSGSAMVSKNDASVDNMEVQVLENDLITEEDLRAGKWSNAQIKVFWL